ncbi:uncharacterized protein LOC126298898 [Schistocerca gregaria]|uniref:uncharacterized protein LOC126298898 n=1 Tax=Schistocerca gregaria TaxID=7010 RepID=UPI00211EF0E4|nr:uncharacterized protein LOC126298898 [Schistocerca gregaria]
MLAATLCAGALLHLLLSWALEAECGGSPWATAAQEAVDEQNDAEILRAVLTSVAAWERRQRLRHRHRQRRAANVVCYDEVGCFSDSGVFGYLDMLPAPPQEVGTRFMLYSGRTVAPRHLNATSLRSDVAEAAAAFNASLPTKVIVHGFGSSCSHVWVYEMRSALMTVEKCNVICVDWENGAAVPNYVRAAANARLVGRQLAQLLRSLGAEPARTHLIGFSLGAHVAGFAGAMLRNVSRITGLDPAGPLFESQDPHARLDSSDAMFVDVIHSNGENLILGGLGSWQPMGDVDFYPNGGRMQKGCSNLFVGAVSDILWSSEIEGRSLCNHRRAYKFFTDSVSPRCHFPAFPCESYEKFLEGECFPCNGDRQCGNMGYYADRSHGRGTLFLITRDEEPFCAHQYHVRVENSAKTEPVATYGKIQITLIGSSEINETFPLTQKDDEELKAGESLARIVVPHPVLQEPNAVQILYTAYNGWWSSGLTAWHIDKIILTDSFGKSLSVCKKDLPLESGTPWILPLFPGDCNPPKEANDSTTNTEKEKTEIQEIKLNSAGHTSANESYNPAPEYQLSDNTENSPEKLDVKYADTVQSDKEIDKLSWKPVKYQEAIHTNTNSLDNVKEDSRSLSTHESQLILFNVAPDSVTPQHTNNSDGNSSKIAISRRSGSTSSATDENTARPEIKEPVLLARTPAAKSSWLGDTSNKQPSWSLLENYDATFLPGELIATPKPEIREPILNPKTIKDSVTMPPTSVNASESNSVPIPTTNNSAIASTDNVIASSVRTLLPVRNVRISSDILEDSNLKVKKQTRSPSTELSPPPLNAEHSFTLWKSTTENTSRAYSNGSASPNFQRSMKPAHQQLTVQFFPQRLASLLAQAERYARMTVMRFPSFGNSLKPFSASNKKAESVKDTFINNGLANTQYTQRKPKHVGAADSGKNISESYLSDGIKMMSDPVSERQGNLSHIQSQSNTDNVLSDKTAVLVPYTYSYSITDPERKDKNKVKYIPLHYLEGNKTEHFVEKITVTPEEFKNFRTQKVYPHNHAHHILGGYVDGFHPVYSRVPNR